MRAAGVPLAELRQERGDISTAGSVVAAHDAQRFQVVIVGAGFSGLGMAIGLKQAGIEDFVILERAEDGGGTWRDNTYPGCACDIKSDLYSFSFAPNPDWTRTFAPQPEIQSYLRRCIEQFGIGAHLRRGHTVADVAWDDIGRFWRIGTDQGRFVADVLVLATGPLSEPATSAIPGLASFAGTVFHSARWNHDHDLTGERVAVIGTGASSIQFVPQIQPRVGRLLLFQRTPPWILPRQDRAVGGVRRALYRALPLVQRLARRMIYWRQEVLAFPFVYQPRLLAVGEKMARRHLEAQVTDPALRARLTPDYRLGCKRVLLSDDFYPALAQDNAEVITENIREVRPTSIVTEDGVEHEVDTLILATGFQIAEAPFAKHVRGHGGQLLSDAWSAGAKSYLGTTVPGFPNLFTCLGPNTGLGHSSMILMIEAQVTYILDGLRAMAEGKLATVEVRPAVQAAYNDTLQRRFGRSIWQTGCSSRYLDLRERNTTLWPGFTWDYQARTRRFDLADYILTPHGKPPVTVEVGGGARVLSCPPQPALS